MSAEPVAEPVVEESKAPVKKTAVKKTAAKKTGPRAPAKTTAAQRRRDKAANEQADEQGDKIDDRMGDKVERGDDSSLSDEREEWFRAPGLQRMQMDFAKGDLDILRRMNSQIEDVVFAGFTDAFRILSNVYDVVREPEVNEVNGEIIADANGFPIWKKHPVSGSYLEDWSALTIKQRENFLFEITTRLFEWEQKAVEFWTRAMFSKAIFTEHFAIEYDAPMSGTIDDRNAVANRKAAEERYFALMQTAVSRRADAIVRTMTNLMLRLKDTLP